MGEDNIRAISDEEILFRQRNSRKTAIALASCCLEAGAQSPNSTGKELDPCGLDELLEMVFDGETNYCRKDVSDGL